MIQQMCRGRPGRVHAARLEEEGQLSPVEPLDVVAGYVERVAGSQ